MTTPLPAREHQAPFSIPFAHAANADGGIALTPFWKAPKTAIVDRVLYYNLAGLAEHASNWALVTVQKTLVYADRAVDSVDFGADNELLFAAEHALETGDGPMRLTTTGGAPAGLATGVDYFVIRNAGALSVSFATTRDNALRGTAINITDAGTGVHTVVDTATSKRVVAYFSTDSDLAGTNSIAANTLLELTLNRSPARVLDPSETLEVATDEAGTTTLPAGSGHVSGRYIS